MVRIKVVELPRNAPSLYEGGLLGCIQFCHGIARAGMTRVAMVLSSPPPPVGPDLLACVPLRGYDDWLSRAAELIAAWDDKWLLVESMPRHHREDARGDLVQAVAAALLAAATGGIDAVGGTGGRDGDLPF